MMYTLHVADLQDDPEATNYITTQLHREVWSGGSFAEAMVWLEQQGASEIIVRQGPRSWDVTFRAR